MSSNHLTPRGPDTPPVPSCRLSLQGRKPESVPQHLRDLGQQTTAHKISLDTGHHEEIDTDLGNLDIHRDLGNPDIRRDQGNLNICRDMGNPDICRDLGNPDICRDLGDLNIHRDLGNHEDIHRDLGNLDIHRDLGNLDIHSRDLRGLDIHLDLAIHTCGVHPASKNIEQTILFIVSILPKAAIAHTDRGRMCLGNHFLQCSLTDSTTSHPSRGRPTLPTTARHKYPWLKN